jgi:hypothetical protein
MDLDSLDVVATSEKGIEVVIVNPMTGPTDFVITVKGIYSKQFSELIGRAAQRLNKAGPNAPANDVDVMAKVLAQVTLGWRGLTEKGQPVTFSPEAAERVYRNPLVRKQVMDAAMNEGNLVPG